MSFSIENARKVAKLSRIRVSDEELQNIVPDMRSIFSFIEQLSEVDTDGIDVVASVVQHSLPLREDIVTDGDMVQDILENAPDKEYDCFTVPKVLGAD